MEATIENLQKQLQVCNSDKGIYFQLMSPIYEVGSIQHRMELKEFAEIYNVKRAEVMSFAEENVT